MEREPFLPAKDESPVEDMRPFRELEFDDDFDDEKLRRDVAPAVRRKRAFAAGFILVLILTSAMFFHPVRHGIGRVRHCFHRKPQSLDDRVHAILSKTPLFDGHNDFPLLIRFLYNNHIYDGKFTEPFTHGGIPMHVDLPRLRMGQQGGVFWSLFTPCPENGTDFSDENYAASVQLTLQQIDLVTRLRAAYPDDFSGNVDSTTALAAFLKGQIISPTGIEGLHQIGNSVANLRRYHSMGVRYATLTHNCHNKFADAALLESPMRKAEPYWGGVSPLGRRLVTEMNRMGMMVDLSHTSVDTMLDVLGGNPEWPGSAAPIIYSHSSAYAVCPHPRNVPDHVLQLVKARNSLVMVNFAPDFVSCVAGDNPNGIPDFVPENSTLAHVVDHIMHIGNLIGFDHVGFGSDFDGIGSTPKGLEDVSKWPDLVKELLRRGLSDVEASKVVGGNLLRVWADVDAVALKMQAAGVPAMEDDLPAIKFGVLEGAPREV